MKIKEKDEQQMVIEFTRHSGGSLIIGGFVFTIIWTIFALVVSIIWLKVFFSVLGIYIILSILRVLRAIRIVLDKPNQTVTIMTPSLLLVRRQRVILLPNVRSVVIDYAPKKPELSGGDSWASSEDAWKVSLNNGKKTEIAHTKDKEDMFNLASEISKFIGSELVDNR